MDAVSINCSPQKMLRSLAASGEQPANLVFESELNIQIRLSHSRVQGGFGAVRSLCKDCLERCPSSEDGTRTFVTLVHWMDVTLVCEELLLLSRQLSPPHGFLYHE